MKLTGVVVATTLAACGRINFDPTSAAGDSGGDATPPCLSWGSWSTPVAITELNTNTSDETGAALSQDGLEIVFQRSTGGASRDLFWARRPSTTSPFSAPSSLESLNTGSSNEIDASVSRDGDRIYFNSDRATDTLVRLYTADRISPGVYSTPVAVTPESATNPSGRADLAPWVSDDDQDLFYVNAHTGSPAPVHAHHNVTSGVWVEDPDDSIFTNVNGINFEMGFVTLSSDLLDMYFEASVSSAPNDIYHATRPSKTSPFGAPVAIGELNDAAREDEDPELSRDGTAIIFGSTRGPSPTADLYMSTRVCQ